MRHPLICVFAAMLAAAGGCAACDRQDAGASSSATVARTNPPPAAPVTAVAANADTAMNTPNPATAPDKLTLSESEWRKRLSAQQYQVLREKGTERAFTGKYWDTKTPGVYKCAGCGTVLFTSGDKFDSGCGWPSFDKMAKAGVVQEHADTSHGMVRTEVTCAKCGGHLGHVFDDGPTDTHLRYCINSASIELDASGDAKKDEPKK